MFLTVSIPLHNEFHSLCYNSVCVYVFLGMLYDFDLSYLFILILFLVSLMLNIGAAFYEKNLNKLVNLLFSREKVIFKFAEGKGNF